MNPVLIMVAPNGARRSQKDHPKLPISPNEIGATAKECLDAGAGAIHVHVRDRDAAHSLDPDAYRAAIGAIRAHCRDDLAIQVTSEAAGRFSPAIQMESVRALRPGAVSIAMREILSGDEAEGLRFLAWCAETGIAVQYILYDEEDLHRFSAARNTRTIPGLEQPRILLVLGRYGAGMESTLADFDTRHRALSETGLDSAAIWSVCAFGKGELACLEAAMAAGGHARVGFENSVIDEGGKPARDNAERVERVVEIARRLGREPVNGTRARDILGLRERTS